MEIKTENDFHIGWQEILWSSKLFTMAVFISWTISMLFYFLSLAAASPESVNTAIISGTSMAMEKVDLAAEHLNLMWSIFFFNSLAVVTTSVGTGLLPYIQKVSIAELKLRARNQKYTTYSVKVEKLFQLLNSRIKDSAQKMDPGIAKLRSQDNSEIEGSIWKCAKYNKEHFRLLAYVIPHIIPIITLTLNGMLLGIMLSFFIFNGTLSSYDLMGAQSIVPGILFSVSYFLAFILPHGIIEIPVIIMAAALGYRFARVYSDKILEDKLLSGNEAESLEHDISYMNGIAKEYIRSSYLWTMVSMMLILLLAAAYIEADITPGVAQQVTDFLSLLLF
ncbi:stage II sporulation protein M [Methanomethylovorans sp.]|uniref:stage II sporulation protein M n=1 Tax=Methanomethylovorans sp. TaxID=2758717 RepID=UPI00351C914A